MTAFTQRPTYKLKMRSQFPASVTATSPITLAKTGGTYAFGFDSTVITAAIAAADSFVNVKDFGAIGNGVTNDTAAIQAACDAATALGTPFRHDGVGWNIPVIVPPGNYLCGDLIVSDHAVLTGQQSSGERPTATLTQKTGTTWIAGNAGTTTGSGVVGLYLIGLGSATSSIGLSFATANRSIFSGNYFDNFGMQGMLVSGLGMKVHDNFAFNCLLNRAAVVAKHGAIEINGTDDFIYNNEASCSVTGDYTSANLYCCGLMVSGNNHFIQDNVGEISDVGIRIEANRCRMSGNRCDSNWGHGLEITGSGNQISNALGYNNSLHADNAFSDCLTSGGNNLFSNCLGNGSTKSPLYAFEDTKVGDSNKNRYVGCSSLGCTTTYGFAAFAGSAVAVTSGQDRTFTALDATPSVDNYENWVTNNSGGATTITNFDDGVPGQKLLIRMGDALTSIGHGGGISTPTAATVGPYTAGQYQGLINVNGNWRFTTNNP